MRIVSAFLLALCLAGCNRGTQSKDAVREGIVEHLKSRQFNVSSMDLNVTSVKFDGKRADAVVSLAPKGAGGAAGQGMTMQYKLEQQDGKWVVVGRSDSGGMPHGGAMQASPDASGQQGATTAPAENPHGGKMPSPEDLPPATKKK